MWIARSTWPPAGAGPSAMSWGAIPRAKALAGARSSAKRINARPSIGAALVGDRSLVEVRPEPALGLLERHAPSPGIIFELVAADAGHAEILAVAIAEVEAGHGRSRKHREILGQRHFAGIAAEHLEQHRLEAVVGASRVAGRGADALIFLANELLVRQMLVGIAPETVAHFRVQNLGEAFGEAVCKRLQQDVRIIVILGLEPFEMSLEPVDADREAANPVLAFGIDEVGEAHVRPPFALLHLLAKEGQSGPVIARKHKDVVAPRIHIPLAAPQPDGGLGRDPALGDDPLEHLLRVVEEVLRAVPNHRVVQD